MRSWDSNALHVQAYVQYKPVNKPVCMMDRFPVYWLLSTTPLAASEHTTNKE